MTTRSMLSLSNGMASNSICRGHAIVRFQELKSEAAEIGSGSHLESDSIFL